MLTFFIPKQTRGRIARKIVLDCLAQIPNEIVCKAKCRGVLTSGQLGGRLYGLEISIGAELVQQQLLELIGELPLSDPRLAHGVFLMHAVGGGPCAVRLHQFLTASCEVSRVRAAKELSESPEPRDWSIRLLCRLMGSEKVGSVRSDLAKLIADIARCNIGEPFAVEGAAALLEDNHESIRIDILEILRRNEKLRDTMVPRLAARFFREVSSKVRCRIVECLGQSAKCEEICMPVLLSALECEDSTALASMIALKRFGARASLALPRLTLELLCGDPARADMARKAIVAIQGDAVDVIQDSGMTSILVLKQLVKPRAVSSIDSALTHLVRIFTQPSTVG